MEYAMCAVGFPSAGRPLTSCSLSVGDVSALARKGDTTVPNEDCLYAFDDGRYAVHVIADGHHGFEASHDFVEALAALYDDRGPALHPAEALELIHKPAPVESGPDDTLPASRSTLLIARLDRRKGRLQGVNIGDSALYVGSIDYGIRRVVEPNTHYSAPWDPDLLAYGSPPNQFSVPTSPGEWILSCSDGVTECHYGQPETSIQPSDLESIMIRACGSPDTFVETLATLALMGVRGNPGGQDNVAIIASVA